MTDRKEELRRQAALCHEDARRATDPKQRAKLIALAETFLRLARYEPINLDSMLIADAEADQPATQQQQQIQPKKDDE
jgi:Holliday junction resolvase-like predicted endonuclease